MECPNVYDRNEHPLKEYDIVEFFENYPPNIEGKDRSGYREWIKDNSEKYGGHYIQFSHGYWQLCWDDTKHGWVLSGMNENVQNWIRDRWYSERIQYVRSGVSGESNIPFEP